MCSQLFYLLGAVWTEQGLVLLCAGRGPHTHLPVPAGAASRAASQGSGCWVWVTRCYWERDKELKQDVGHIYFKFFVAYALWHDASGKVNSTSGLVMPCAYYSPAEGFQPLGKCQCLAGDRHPSRRAICPVGWEESLTAGGDAGWEGLVHRQMTC